MEKLEKLKQILAQVNDGLTTEDFNSRFKIVLDFLAKMKLANKEEMLALDTKYSEIVNDLKKGSADVINQTKKYTNDFLTTELTKLTAKVETKLSEVENGADGRDADETVVAENASKLVLEALKPLIPTVSQLAEQLPQEGDRIRDGLELIPKGPEQLKIDAIYQLREILDDLEKKILGKVNFVGGGGGVGKQNLYYYDLTSYLDGSTLTFNMPAFARILKIETWSGPVLRPLVDWTSDANAHTVTFTVDPATYLAVGQTCIVYYAV